MATAFDTRISPEAPASTQILAAPGALAFLGEGGSLLISRERIADAIELLVALLDVADHDPEAETTGAEDDFMDHREDGGPGCRTADPDAGVDDLPEGVDEGI